MPLLSQTADPRYVYVERDGTFQRADGRDEFIVAEDAAGAWSQLCIGNGDIVLDLGANIGTSARRFLHAGAAVVAVEPDEANVAGIERNAPEALVRHAAVAAEAGTINFHLSDVPWRQGTLAELNSGSEPVTVTAVALEELCAEFVPTVIKVDIEGAEWDLPWEKVLAGVRELGMELHDVAGHGAELSQLVRVLDSAGFSVIVTDELASRDDDRILLARRCTPSLP